MEEHEKVIVEVVLKKSFDVNDMIFGLSAGIVTSIRYDKDHFKRWQNRVSVYLISSNVACGSVGWDEERLNEYTKGKGLYSRRIL